MNEIGEFAVKIGELSIFVDRGASQALTYRLGIIHDIVEIRQFDGSTAWRDALKFAVWAAYSTERFTARNGG